MPLVLNRKTHPRASKGPNTVYIGRGSPWGLPFDLKGKHPNDGELDAYRKYLNETPGLLTRARDALAGKDLVCNCAPFACHGNVLLAVANEPVDEDAHVQEYWAAKAWAPVFPLLGSLDARKRSKLLAALKRAEAEVERLQQELTTANKLLAARESDMALNIRRIDVPHPLESTDFNLEQMSLDDYRTVGRNIAPSVVTYVSAIAGLFDINDRMSYLYLKLWDGMTKQFDQIFDGIAEQGKKTARQLIDQERADGDTEIGYESARQLQARLTGLKCQSVLIYPARQALIRARNHAVAASGLNWGAYVTVREIAKARHRRADMREAFANYMAMTEAQKQRHLSRKGIYLPRTSQHGDEERDPTLTFMEQSRDDEAPSMPDDHPSRDSE